MPGSRSTRPQSVRFAGVPYPRYGTIRNGRRRLEVIDHKRVAGCVTRRASARVALRRRERRAAVDDEDLARDVARLLREQEAHGGADVPARSLDAERGRLLARLAR